MRLAVFLLIAGCFQAGANTNAQQVNLSFNNAPLESVFREIKAQTGYLFVYNETIPQQVGAVSIHVNKASVEEALRIVLKEKPFSFTVIEKTIVIKESGPPSSAEKQGNNIAAPPLLTVKGRIVNEAGEPVAASVVVKGTKTGATTDANGYFELKEVDENAILVITGVSIEPYEVRVSNRTFINVRVKQKVSDLDEAVVVAYGTTTRRINTGAVTVVKGEQIATLPNRSFDRSLQGLVPGLQVTTGTGQPGAGLSNMVLRGIATGTDVSFGSTVRNPLIVIDGIPVSQESFQQATTLNATPITNPLAQLNPSDIETISVLKDAVAIALYGSKASNGVILVTTKKGKAGKTVFGFRHQTDIASKLMGQVKVLNPDDYLKLMYETYKNTNAAQWTDQAILADLKSKFPTKTDGSFYPAPDWDSALYARNATTISNELSVSGGNEKTNFYLNLEYTTQNGIVKKTGYDRQSIRFNFESRPASWFRMGFNSTFSYNVQNYTNSTEASSGYAIMQILSPLNPIVLENGQYLIRYSQGSNSSSLANPAAAAEYNINRNVTYRGLNKIYGEVKFLNYFTLTSNVGTDLMLAELKTKVDPRFATSSTAPRITEQDDRRISLINTNTLRFDKSLGYDHLLNVILGQETQLNNEKILGAEAVGTIETFPYYDQLTSSGYTMDAITSASNKQRQLSYFGQANYSYRNKYLLSASVRTDGSSKFGNDKQWGMYWSAGAGWVITEESFMKDLKWLNYLKVRGSVGEAGNSAPVNDLVRFDKLVIYRYLGETAVAPLSSPGNPDIQREQTFTWDMGLELKLFQNRLTFTADIYRRKTRDLVYSTNLPSLAGNGTLTANIGDINNKGIELAVSAKVIERGDFYWNVSGNWSANQNILIKANVPLVAITGGILGNEEGRNFNSFYMPVWAGVNPDDGKPRWLDKDGKFTSNYTLAKKEFVGKPQPDGFGSMMHTLGYKGISFSANFYYQYGAKIYSSVFSNPLLSDGLYPYVNQIKGALDYWKKPGDITPNPRRILNNNDGGNKASTRYLLNGDYIRLSNVTLAYSFGKAMLSRMHLSNFRIYVQGNNLAVFTAFSGPDPDNINVAGATGFAYPNQRTFSAGLNLGF